MADDKGTAPEDDHGDDGSIRELRLALVCYGGVSLAIYMHGTTKEIHKLVVASKGRRTSPTENPFPEQTTEHVYWDLLGELQQRDGIRTRVVVDIISGTSAGGINGVFLAKALAGNQDQQGLREIWLQQGDIHRLTSPGWLPVAGRLGVWVAKGATKGFFDVKAPLDGDFLLGQAYGALKGMNVSPVQIGDARPDTLMPSGHDLRLFVTTTDFHGYRRLAPAYAPIRVPSEWHRHVYAFERTPTHDAFGAAYDPALAFAARSTSSFPGAFPPARLEDVKRVLHAELPPGFDDEFFPTYALAKSRPGEAWFVDGGVLDNFPFRAAIDAIFRAPASSEVDRRLLYIEPDPGSASPADAPAASKPKAPGFLPTVFGSLSSIPANQPIAGALFDLQDFNDRVDRVADVIREAYGAIEAAVGDAAAAAKEDKDLNAAVHAKAAGLGPSYTAYVRLKVGAVVDALAEATASLCDFPDETNQAAFVTDVLRRWATTRGPLREGLALDDPAGEVATFLRTFDLGYTERRLKFVLKGLNALYADVDARIEPPDRAALDRAKRRLWDLIERVTAPVAALQSRSPEHREDAVAPLKEQVRALFANDDVDRAMAVPAHTWDAVIEAFEQPRATQFDEARKALGDYLNRRLAGFGDEVYGTVKDVTEHWGETAKNDLRLRFTGFPIWDAVLYPMQKVANLGELNRVEVVRMSPLDTTLLQPDTAGKLTGVGLHHFGAFFHPDGRANDYVWGRLDGAERLVWLLLHGARGGEATASDDATMERYSRRAFAAVASEEASLRTIAPRPFDAIARGQGGAVPATPGSPSAGS